MTAQDGPRGQQTAAANAESGKGRGVAAWALIVIASILMPLALVAFWGQRTLTDTERYVQTVAPLVEEEAVKDAIITRTTDTLMAAVEENEVIKEAVSALPPAAAERLIPAITGAIESLVGQVATRIVNSEQFEAFWVEANTKLQRGLIRALSGDNSDGAIRLEGDQLVLDTSPIAEAVQAELVERGLTALEGRPLPAAAEQKIVLMEDSQLREARIIYAITIPVARYLIPALAIMALAGVALSTRRARLVMGIGLGIAIGIGLLGVGLGVAKSILATTAPTSQAQALLDVFWVTLTRYLTTAVGAWFAAGVIVAFLGWFGGRSRPATSLRDAISGSLTRAGSSLRGGPLASLGGFLQSHWRAVFIGIGSVATGSLFVFSPITASAVLWISALALALTAVVTWLRGAATESSAAHPAPDAPLT